VSKRSPLSGKQILLGVSPFATASLGVISTGWGSRHPLAGTLIMIAASLATILILAGLDPEWRTLPKDGSPIDNAPAPGRPPSLYHCESCRSKNVERRVDREARPLPLTIITCRDCGAKADRPFSEMFACEQCGSMRVRSRAERLPLRPLYTFRCLQCGTKFDWWDDCIAETCNRCGSTSIRKTSRIRRPIGATFLTCRDCQAVTRVPPPR
jgi:hypothetical protein